MAPKPNARSKAVKRKGSAKAKAKAKARVKVEAPDRQPLWVLENTEPRIEHPPWATHFINVVAEELQNLMASRLAGGGPAKLTLNVWSDCCGMTNEMLAARDLQDALKAALGIDFELKLYAACDKSKDAREFTLNNHIPAHMTDDMFDRDFVAGTFKCSLCCQDHDLPTEGVDVYVCSFSCGPWSPRGKRLGLDDAGANTVFQMIDSVRHMRPLVWVAENVISLHHKNPKSGNIEFNTISEFMTERLVGKRNNTFVEFADPAVCEIPSSFAS